MFQVGGVLVFTEKWLARQLFEVAVEAIAFRFNLNQTRAQISVFGRCLVHGSVLLLQKLVFVLQLLERSKHLLLVSLALLENVFFNF